MEDITKWTNAKAMMHNAGEGGTEHPSFKVFTVDEIMQHLGLYILHGIAPSPQIEMKLDSSKINPAKTVMIFVLTALDQTLGCATSISNFILPVLIH